MDTPGDDVKTLPSAAAAELAREEAEELERKRARVIEELHDVLERYDKFWSHWWVGWRVAAIAFGAIYVAVHFIQKYW